MATRNPPAYRVISTAHNAARLTTADGRIVDYWAPRDGGYVRVVTEGRPGTLGEQVVEDSGSTMMWSPGKPLSQKIRRHVAAIKR